MERLTMRNRDNMNCKGCSHYYDMCNVDSDCRKELYRRLKEYENAAEEEAERMKYSEVDKK